MESLLEHRLTWPHLLVMAAGMFVVYELGYRIGRHRREVLREVKKSQADVAVAALLALLGLMLAFSFEIGTTRFERRKELVLEEANAITTTYLRATLVPAPYDQHIQGLLRQYVDARMGLKSSEDLERAIRKSAVLHVELWADATAAAHEAPTPTTALFITSLNQMIDLQEARVTVALFQRMPSVIFASLYLVSLLSICMVGLRAGIDGSRGPIPEAILIASIMSVIALIASLDDPLSRMFHINTRALEDTQQMMTQTRAAT